MFSKRLQLLLTFALCLSAASNRGAEIIRYNGFEVYDDAVVAKLKNPAGGELKAMNVPGGNVEELGKTVPGLVAIERVERGELRALNAEQREAELAAWIAELEATGQFEYVEPNFVRSIGLAPTDAAFANGTLWGLHNFGQFGGTPGVDINATNAWDVTVGSTNVIVAVVDSGIRYTHQDLAAQMWVNPDEIPGNGADDDNDGFIDNVYGLDAVNNDGDPMDDNGHGTHVAGTIGAAANNGGQHVGVAWQVRLMAGKFLAANNSGPVIAAIRCVDFAVQNGANVINASYGGYGFSQAEYDAILAARNAGVLFVAAAGNDRNDNDQFPMYPTSFDLDNIISVAAMDRVERLATFSNFGATTVDVAAPGVEIFSTWIGSDTDYNTIQGTSMAAPHVTGIAALVFANSPNASYIDVRSRITNGVVAVPAFAGRMTTGGRVDAFKALTGGVDGILEVSVIPAPGAQLTIGTNQTILVRVSDGLPVTNATVRMTGPGGTINFQNDGAQPDAVAEDDTYTGQFLVPNTPGPLNFTLTVTAPGKTNFTQAVTYEAVPRPDNDLFANARKVPAEGAIYEQTTRFATLEASEPKHAGVETVDASVWYTWSLPQATDVIVDTAGTAFDTVVAVYTGNNVGSLTEIASADNVGEKRQAYVQFRAQAGVSYRIAIAGATSNESGLLRVRFERNGQPDNIPPIVQITDPPSGFTVHADQIQISGTSFDPAPNASGVREVIVRVNDDIGSSAAGTTNWVAPVLLEEGVNIIRVIAFDFAENRSAEQQLTIYYRELETQNDLFGRAQVLTGFAGTVTGNNTSAGKELNEPNHAGNTGGKSLWYSYTPTEDGVLLVSTAGSGFDTLLGVYTGPRVSQLSSLASSDDLPGGSMQSEVTLGVRAGQTYYIAVDGFDAASGNVTLNYNLNSRTTFPFTATSTTGGSVSPGSGLFPMDTTVSVTATPDPYWEFESFRTPGGALISEVNPLSVVIRGATNLVAHFRPRQFTDDFESGGFNRLPYQVNGWAVTGDVVSTGQFAARSTAARNQNRVTNSLVVVTNLLPGIGSFEYRVSTETNYDHLEFYVDGVLRARWSGEHSWSTFEFEIVRSGSQRLEWRYTKDAAIAVGLDAVFIDNLDLPIGEVPAVPPGVQISTAGSARQITISGAPAQAFWLESSTDLENWANTAVLITDASGQVSYVDSSEAPYRFYRVRLQ